MILGRLTSLARKQSLKLAGPGLYGWFVNIKKQKKNGLHTYRNLNEYWSQQSNAYIMKEHEFLKIHYKFCWFGWSFFFFIGVLVLINISKKYYIKK